MDRVHKQKLKKFIRELEQYRGRHTELVSVYVPAGYELIKIIQHLQQEQGTASNIKDKVNRDRVIDSLEKMIRHLKLYKKTPEHGLAAFSGNVSDKENKVDIKVWSIEPPEPIKVRLYRCDQTFMLDILRDMYADKEVYGLIVIDNREGNIGLLKGNTITQIYKADSDVPGKTTKGGQCVVKESLVESENENLIKIKDIKIGDKVKSYNFKEKKFIYSDVLDKWIKNKKELFIIETEKNKVECSKDHLFFLENGKTKAAEELTKEDILLDNNAKPIKINDIKRINKKIGMIDISVKNKNFIANCVIVHNSQQRYARIRAWAAHDFYKKIAAVVNKQFLEMKEELKGIIIGGPGPTKETFFDGAYLNNEIKKKVLGLKDIGDTGESGLHELVEKSADLLAQESITKEKELLNRFFTMLAKEPEKTAYGKKEVENALMRGSVDTLLLSEDLEDNYIEDLEQKAERFGTKVELVSMETKEGVQLKELGGIGAILRFAVY